ncbi:hypothetical protein CAPTEDRAFT_149727 [Capitella teleta]|uniref:Uncharacterized protein n=1 Tax=Capitella teleta TaxID=283909 RepID=R7TSJ6_CAPTE|nr:hypothetical protein CAPTEDRAFT_149727 [Capitella teleta]|eukprot:ELT96582.1 hypothetical protein CAPTEDRAFT_149727 [Capitella teleta]
MTSNAVYTFIGCLIGTLIYGVFQSALDGALKPSIPKVTNPWLSSSFASCALPLASVLIGVVCAFEVFRPSPSSLSWLPYVSGAVIGCLHLPLAISIGELLGGSSSFLVMWAQVLVGPLSGLSPFIQKFKWGFKRWWQIFYVGGIIAGGYLSASSANHLGQGSSVSQCEAVLGGALVCLGSRIAAGCTSGHGFSGTSLLHPTSLTLVVAMFSGAFAALTLL